VDVVRDSWLLKLQYISAMMQDDWDADQMHTYKTSINHRCACMTNVFFED